MDFTSVRKGDFKIAVVGLGYVGLPLVVAFGKKFSVIGYDISEPKTDLIRNGIDSTGEFKRDDLISDQIEYTADPVRLKEASIIIVTVPTPIDKIKKPDLGPVISASKTIGGNLSVNTIVIYESTVYPGVTEDICIPILESESGLKCGFDFTVGYSPERINPGDDKHTLKNVIKIVSGWDEATLDAVAMLYEEIVEAGVHRAASIKIAEAAKVIENIQRDLNIALMNELAIIFNIMGISTLDVLAAAGTKWNFIKLTPGLVGGHCIGVDPYYLTQKAQEIGYIPEVILAGRRINDSMGKFIAEKTIKKIIKGGKKVKGSKVLILGMTFKENVPDIRNSKVIDIVHELEEYGIKVFVADPIAAPEDVLHEYGIKLVDLTSVGQVDAVIIAVTHKKYQNMVTLEWLKAICSKGQEKGAVIDVKGMLNRVEVENEGLLYWAL
jgi:UDP-N-acetyl-D-glucosamine/UDP-N-acetyl-D-galactosamine dehydrogenase